VVPIAATEAQVGSETESARNLQKSLVWRLDVSFGCKSGSFSDRYPWCPNWRKMGFALTHLGLIVPIAGSAAVIHLSVGGMLLLRTDSAPNQIYYGRRSPRAAVQ